MVNNNPEKLYLKDYKDLPYTILGVSLKISIYEKYTEVVSKMKFSVRGLFHGEPLILDGVDLQLISVCMAGKVLQESEYILNSKNLILTPNKENFEVEIVNRIYPSKNSSLEGLYQSGENLYTQCEPEGFRKITYFYDRPDILTTYDVTLEADYNKFPVMLSNGNLKESGKLDGDRHFVTWVDPFPKPSYLFAVVMGQLSKLEDFYTTKSGKKITLEIYSEDHNIKYCDFAMSSLKKAMSWDEDVYGFECDLDSYKIVSVSDFNMGAMENKGLNIFNNALILSDPKMTTDDSYISIESVIGHEYFHNWTGNRITCRDWFQLCVKEGLTVFRDQKFTEDMTNKQTSRIDQVISLRNRQYLEDDGPLSHPPRPDSFIEINNFYTSTVYEKSAECFRMLKLILGDELYFKAIKEYVSRFDGKAITLEDLMKLMSEVSKKDLDQFTLWFTESGRPLVDIDYSYDEQNKSLKIIFKQQTKTPPTKSEVPRYIPVKLGLIDEQGDSLLKTSEYTINHEDQSIIFPLTKTEETLLINEVDKKPILSVFRDFSAPVDWKLSYQDSDLISLIKFDKNIFSSWEACQRYYMKVVQSGIESSLSHKDHVVDKNFVEMYGEILLNSKYDPSFSSKALLYPSNPMICSNYEKYPIDKLLPVKKMILSHLGKNYQVELYRKYSEIRDSITTVNFHGNYGLRALKNLCLQLLVAANDENIEEILWDEFSQTKQFTDTLNAFALLISREDFDRQKAIDLFYKRWSDQDLALDYWFQCQASSLHSSTLENVLQLVNHKDYKRSNPNRVRSLTISFCRGNYTYFHRTDGSGYRFCASECLLLDKSNPQLSAALAKSFTSFYKLDDHRKSIMKKVLQDLKKETTSRDLYEVLESIKF